MKEKELLKNYIKEEKTRKVFEHVFDELTTIAVHKTARKGYFQVLEHVVSTGKEAHVFRGTDKAGKPRAVKIYKIKTSKFKNMEKYIKGDARFKKVRKTKKDIVFAWAKKEFKNLALATQAGASVPRPAFVFENVLVMEFVGGNTAAKTLKETKAGKKEFESYFNQTIDFMSKIFFRKELIHSDLSEYNILVQNKKLFFIDMGQSVLATNPNAQEFFERDIKNMSKYFSKHGIKTDFEDFLKKIKSRKKMYKKKE